MCVCVCVCVRVWGWRPNGISTSWDSFVWTNPIMPLNKYPLLMNMSPVEWARICHLCWCGCLRRSWSSDTLTFCTRHQRSERAVYPHTLQNEFMISIATFNGSTQSNQSWRVKNNSISPEFDNTNRKQLTLLFAMTAKKVNMKVAVVFWITAAY